MREVDKLYPMNSRQKLLLFGVLLLVLCHIVACLYFSTSSLEGFSPGYDAWIPTNDVQLLPIGDGLRFTAADNRTLDAESPEARRIASMQYFRAFYYATNVLTGLGKTVEPKSDTQFTIAVIFMFSGFIITAVVVDNVQKRFTASAFEQKEFFVVRMRVQLFLRRQNAPLAIHHRAKSYLDYWWSAHRGARIEELLAELPITHRRDILRSICSPALQTLALMRGVRPVLSRFETAFVDSVHFVLYGQGEFVYHEGDNARWMYFSLHGAVGLKKGNANLKKIPLGGFFGAQALEREEGTAVYIEDAVATSGCILIRLSCLDITKLREVFDDLPGALLQLERRLLDNKLARFSSDTVASRDSKEAPSPRLRSLLIDPIDPDCSGAVAWETWLFGAMTIQWIVTLFHMSFGVRPDELSSVDGLNVFLELLFFVDVYIRSRVGYHEFGNKIMDLRRIRRRYFRSLNFVIDLAALIPLFTINWIVTSARYELLNINKLLRLLKVPKQFMRLEQRYLKRTTELRIVKLCYYAFLATHLSGCVYHDFSSHLSTANLKDPKLSDRKTEFGWNLWLLVSSLKDADNGLKYFSSLFWAFGLMSASYQGELPKTTPQCTFSVVTMMCGFFLFAYVIGNFSDVIEMVDDENRGFNARIGSLRHLFAHFTLPEALSGKLKGFFFFCRYHTITQERGIEAVLPLSLVIDIRLLNLQPMITKVPFMCGMEPAITRMLMSQLSQVLVLKSDYVYRCGDEGTDMFFVFTGILAVMSHHDLTTWDTHAPKASWWSVSGAQRADSDETVEGLRETSELVAGNFFGENALFSDSPRNAFVLAKTSCILYALSRSSLNIVFELFPTWKKQVTQAVKIQQKQHRLRSVPTAQIRGSRPTAGVRGDDSDVGADEGKIDGTPSVSPVQQVEVRSRWKRVMSSLLEILTRGTPAQGRTHIRWLWMIVFCTVFNAVVAPYRISVDALERWTGMCIVIRLVDIFCDIMFTLDIWFNWHLRESAVSIELYEQNLLDRYKKERLLWDVISAVPIDYMLAALGMKEAMWFRLLRCVKVVNLVPYLNEINRVSVSYEITRFGTIWLQCLIYLFWVACAYLSLAVFGGFAAEWNGWAPSHELEYHDIVDPDAHLVLLRFLRGLFYATTAFAKKAKTFYPETTGHLVFSISMSFLGTLVMAFMIGEMASLYISYIRNEVEFRKNHITLELFLSRYKVSAPIRDRVQVYLTTLWSSHAGVDYESVLGQLPKGMRTEAVQHIAGAPMRLFIDTVFGPLLRGDRHCTNELVCSVASELKFVGYPRGELVIAEGVLSGSMYFVVKGQLILTSTRPIPPSAPTRFRKGEYFGEKGILSLAVSRFSVRALKACDLFSLSSDGMKRVLQSHGFLQLAFESASAVVGEIRVMSGDPTLLVKNAETWKAVLRKTLEARRQRWIFSSGANHSNSLPTTSRGITLWCSLVVDILDGENKDSGLSIFELFFQLLTVNGAIFDRPNVQSGHRSSRVISSGSGAGRTRFRDMVAKLSRGDAKSRKSSRSTKVHSIQDGNDQVEDFVPEE
jgi:CRP-like cAMP-binding protein